jgi:hypothetical protein
MKKYLSILVALVMVLGLSGKAMATAGNPTAIGGVTGTIDVTATVASYAAITGLDTITIPVFTGYAGEIENGSDTFSVERNRSVNVAISVTPLTGPDGDTILTSVTPENTDLLGRGLDNIDVIVSGTLGAISDQAAGDYSATVTVTVSAI